MRNAEDLTRWAKHHHKLEIIVTTPRIISDLIKPFDHHSDDHPFWALDFVVFDEADMLLDGAYLYDVENIMEKVKLVRRNMITNGFLKVRTVFTHTMLFSSIQSSPDLIEI